MATTLESVQPSSHQTKDLAWLACQAATEIDNLILKRSQSLEAVRGLASTLTDPGSSLLQEGQQSSLIDPTTTVVLTRALRELTADTTETRLRDLLRAAGKVVNRLVDVSSRTASSGALDNEALTTLRSFCLALSRHAAAMSPVPVEPPEHPSQR